MCVSILDANEKNSRRLVVGLALSIFHRRFVGKCSASLSSMVCHVLVGNIWSCNTFLVYVLTRCKSHRKRRKTQWPSREWFKIRTSIPMNVTFRLTSRSLRGMVVIVVVCETKAYVTTCTEIQFHRLFFRSVRLYISSCSGCVWRKRTPREVCFRGHYMKKDTFWRHTRCSCYLLWRESLHVIGSISYRTPNPFTACHGDTFVDSSCHVCVIVYPSIWWSPWHVRRRKKPYMIKAREVDTG